MTTILLPVDQALVDRMREHLNVETSTDLGVIEGLTIRRYARAVGETNPLYFDSEFARANGYHDIIAPLNMLVSVMDWSEGSANEDLRHDGTEPGETLPGVPASGYRLMGGGEDITFYGPVYPGSHLTRTSALKEVTMRETRSGPMAVAKILRRYFADGELVQSATQTILVR